MVPLRGAPPPGHLSAHSGAGRDRRQPDRGSGFLGSELKRLLCLLTPGLVEELEENVCKASALTHHQVLKVEKHTEPDGSSGKVPKKKRISLTRTC